MLSLCGNLFCCLFLFANQLFLLENVIYGTKIKWITCDRGTFRPLDIKKNVTCLQAFGVLTLCFTVLVWFIFL